MGGEEGHDGEAGLFEQGEVLECGGGFDGGEVDGAGEWLADLEIDGGPVAFRGSGVGIGCADDGAPADNSFFLDAVVVEDEVAQLHGAEVVTGLIVADAIPAGGFVFEELSEGISGRFLFDEPVAGHGLERREKMGSGNEEQCACPGEGLA